MLSHDCKDIRIDQLLKQIYDENYHNFNLVLILCSLKKRYQKKGIKFFNSKDDNISLIPTGRQNLLIRG
jgi:hypothetical protein